MIGCDPRDGSEKVIPVVEPAALRAGQADIVPIWSGSPLAPAGFAGRRISFRAWTLAAIVGACLWTVIFKIIL